LEEEERGDGADAGAKIIWERTDAGRTGADSVEKEEVAVEGEEEVDWSFCDDRRVEVEKDCVAAVLVMDCTRDGAAALWGNREAVACRPAQFWPRLTVSALRKAARIVC